LRPARAGRVVVGLALCGLTSACTDEGQAPVLTAVFPGEAYSSLPTPVVIQGEGFRPPLALSAMSGGLGELSPAFDVRLVPSGTPGATGHDLGTPRGRSPTILEATVPAGLDPGPYDLLLTDARGRTASLPDAFTSLGPDRQPPRILLLSPSSPALFADAAVPFVFTVEDATPAVIFNVTAGQTGSDGSDSGESCTELPCAVTRQTPVLPDGVADLPYTVTATAQDAVGNASSASFSFRVVHRPTITQILPSQGGPVEGGTSFAVEGTWLPPEGRVWFDGELLAPDGGEHAPDGQSIRGWTPAHAPGNASVVLRSDAGDLPLGGFLYRAPPVLKAVVPATLPLDPAHCYVTRVFGDNLPSDGIWSLGRAATDATTLDVLASTPTLVRLCVGARATGAAGVFDLLVDSSLGGSGRLEGALSFVSPAPGGPARGLTPCECP